MRGRRAGENVGESIFIQPSLFGEPVAFWPFGLLAEERREREEKKAERLFGSFVSAGIFLSCVPSLALCSGLLFFHFIQ